MHYTLRQLEVFLAVARTENISRAAEALAMSQSAVSGALSELERHFDVLLFDRTRSLSLHMFEHVHGESRDRGQAMVDLGQMYERQGFEIDPGEMPDFLPLFLEYLSTQSDAEVHELLGQTLHIVANLRTRLQKRDSIYANAMLALEAIAGKHRFAPWRKKFSGLAADGGLYVPESWPQFSADQISALAGLSYVDTAVAVMAPFVGDSLDRDEASRCECRRLALSRASMTVIGTPRLP